jgi:hypothetical protein
MTAQSSISVAPRPVPHGSLEPPPSAQRCVVGRADVGTEKAPHRRRLASLRLGESDHLVEYPAPPFAQRLPAAMARVGFLIRQSLAAFLCEGEVPPRVHARDCRRSGRNNEQPPRKDVPDRPISRPSESVLDRFARLALPAAAPRAHLRPLTQAAGQQSLSHPWA